MAVTARLTTATAECQQHHNIGPLLVASPVKMSSPVATPQSKPGLRPANISRVSPSFSHSVPGYVTMSPGHGVSRNTLKHELTALYSISLRSTIPLVLISL